MIVQKVAKKKKKNLTNVVSCVYPNGKTNEGGRELANSWFFFLSWSSSDEISLSEGNYQ